MWFRRTRLPRGIPCLIAGTVYHPHFNDNVSDSILLDYLCETLTTIEGEYPGCGLFLCGDFNRLNIRRLTSQFRMKQLLNKPTRGDHTLDLVMTNLPHLYDNNAVQTLPPFGLSDHSVVIVHPKARPTKLGRSRRSVSRRDLCASRETEIGRYLSNIHWSLVEDAKICEDKLKLLTDIITTSLDNIMPVKQFKVHTDDPSWITAEFKALIKRRQKAFAKGDNEKFRHLQNAVNRERKSLRGKYYASKVNNLKDTKPSQWWSVVKRISGSIPASGSKSLLSNLQLEGFENNSCNPELANVINAAFLKPMECFRPFDEGHAPLMSSRPLWSPSPQF